MRQDRLIIRLPVATGVRAAAGPGKTASSADLVCAVQTETRGNSLSLSLSLSSKVVFGRQEDSQGQLPVLLQPRLPTSVLLQPRFPTSFSRPAPGLAPTSLPHITHPSTAARTSTPSSIPLKQNEFWRRRAHLRESERYLLGVLFLMWMVRCCWSSYQWLA